MEERPHIWDSNSSRVDPQKVSFDAKSTWDRILVVWISSSDNLFDNHQSLGSLSYSLARTTKIELSRLTIPPFVIASRDKCLAPNTRCYTRFIKKYRLSPSSTLAPVSTSNFEQLLEDDVVDEVMGRGGTLHRVDSAFASAPGGGGVPRRCRMELLSSVVFVVVSIRRRGICKETRIPLF